MVPPAKWAKSFFSKGSDELGSVTFRSLRKLPDQPTNRPTDDGQGSYTSNNVWNVKSRKRGWLSNIIFFYFSFDCVMTIGMDKLLWIYFGNNLVDCLILCLKSLETLNSIIKLYMYVYYRVLKVALENICLYYDFARRLFFYLVCVQLSIGGRGCDPIYRVFIKYCFFP